MKIKLSDIAEGKLEAAQAEALQNYFKQGGTWQQLLELNENEVEHLYAAGHDLYQAGEFAQAMTAFAALVQINPYVAKHWIAIGAACQGAQEFAQAEIAYETALVIDEENLSAYFYSAQVCYALGKNEKAMEHLKKIRTLTPKNEEEKILSEKASHILALAREKHE